MAYLTGQRLADALRMTDAGFADGFLIVEQGTTQKKLRINITGKLAELLGQRAVRKAQYKIEHRQLLMNQDGISLTKAVLRKHFRQGTQGSDCQASRVGRSDQGVLVLRPARLGCG
ncbi:MAG: hypothetical protein H7315_19485 [Herminiimonas sp.]|nr:hypothetical protein [Herminiimonas sp.]